MRFLPIFVLAVVGIGIISGQANRHSQEARQKLIDTTPVPAELVQAVVNNDEVFQSLDVRGNAATVRFNLDAWPNKYAIDMFETQIVKITPSLLARFPEISRIDYVGEATFMDPRGNKRRDVGVKATFTRQNASSINWPNVSAQNLPKIADSFSIHPGMMPTN